MKILLTGSTGFIGHYFTDKYSAIYDIQTFSFLHDDFEYLDLQGVETVIHLSALVHQMGGSSMSEYENINVKQTVDLAKKAKNIGVRHFVFMSTVKVYGEENLIPYTEDSPCAPHDDYGKSKCKAEQELQKLETETFTISIIRTPIVYGYGVKANIKNLVSLVNKVPILPLSSIDNKRSIVYVGNLCHLIKCVIDQQQRGIFLAGDNSPISTTLLVQWIAKELDKKCYLLHIPFLKTLLKFMMPSIHKRLFENLTVDNTQTKKSLRLENPYTTEDGIHAMIHGETP
jgi:UDP-glucose 4-epimerase